MYVLFLYVSQKDTIIINTEYYQYIKICVDI